MNTLSDLMETAFFGVVDAGYSIREIMQDKSVRTGVVVVAAAALAVGAVGVVAYKQEWPPFRGDPPMR